jgi:myo-inositol 2-dehydrogenase / D-chiro-inositol 1-dehydrogenase
VRLGFVGAGAIARRHLDILAARSDVEVAAISDVDVDRAQRMADALEARAYEHWRTMLDEEGLDALFVCTPPESHAEPTVDALYRGIHVYVEKPLARARADGSAIVSAWEASASVCAVGYQWRSLDLLANLRSALSGATPGMLISRSIGPTEGARHDLAQASAPGDSWFVDPRRSGGILFELGSHDIDLQLSLAGPVESVQAVAASGRLALAGVPSTPLDDAVAAILRFSNGSLGVVQVAWTEAEEPPVYTLDVLTQNAALHADLDPVFRLHGRADGMEVAAESERDPREATLAGFLAAVESGSRDAVACSPADALGTLSVALACEQSIATGAVVGV